jgi:glycerol-3-phosphate dehydrogenase (NAD(P)+)
MEGRNVAVLGAGAWGAALSIVLHRAGCRVALFPKFKADQQAMMRSRMHSALGIKLPSEINIAPSFDSLETGCDANNDLFKALVEADAVFWTIPVLYTKEVAQTFRNLIYESIPIVICSKGLVWDAEHTRGRLISDALQEYFQNPLCVLSGPNFAKEVAQGEFTASILSSLDINIGKMIADLVTSPSFKVYLNRDIVSAQVAGALKNVLAIACGMVAGLKMGQNTQSVILSQGFSEIVAFAQKCGGAMPTLLGLSGIGDITMTCFSDTSRNTAFGKQIAQGKSPQTQLQSTCVEGSASSQPAYYMARGFDIQTPILDLVYNVLFCGGAPEPSIHSLLKHCFF